VTPGRDAVPAFFICGLVGGRTTAAPPKEPIGLSACNFFLRRGKSSLIGVSFTIGSGRRWAANPGKTRIRGVFRGFLAGHVGLWHGSCILIPAFPTHKIQFSFGVPRGTEGAVMHFASTTDILASISDEIGSDRFQAEDLMDTLIFQQDAAELGFDEVD
jgi:hypothetical protein